MREHQMVWFAGYSKCFCTFLGRDRDLIPNKCEHGHGMVTRPELVCNYENVPLGMEHSQTFAECAA